MMPARDPAVERARLWHARLLNWSRWATGGLGLQLVAKDANLGVVDELDAQAVEAALVRMRHRRPGLWRAVDLFYKRRYTEHTCCRMLHLGGPVFAARLDTVYAWLDLRFEAARNSARTRRVSR